jgi:hypothetical protein
MVDLTEPTQYHENLSSDCIDVSHMGWRSIGQGRLILEVGILCPLNILEIPSGLA